MTSSIKNPQCFGNNKAIVVFNSGVLQRHSDAPYENYNCTAQNNLSKLKLLERRIEAMDELIPIMIIPVDIITTAKYMFVAEFSVLGDFGGINNPDNGMKMFL